MKIKTILSLFLIGLLSFSFARENVFVFADDDSSDEMENLQDDIEKYEKKLDELRDKAGSLSKEIEYANTQINLTELRIQNSINNIRKKEIEISELSNDIENLKNRIKKLETSIDYQKMVLNNRMRTRYKTRDETPFFVIFGGASLNEFIQRSEYLKVMELQDKKLMEEMNNTKNAFSRQKDLVEQKKEEEEELKRQLVQEKANLDIYRADLENSKAEKKRLLEVTQNDEAKYQKLLEDARKELEQIIRAVSVLKGQKSQKVEKGDVIGVQGNTGYSFGDHLHFGVYKYSSLDDIDGWNWYYSNYVDPAKKLKKKKVYWDTGCESAGTREIGKGSWEWPMKDPTISQGYGNTCWSKIYYGGKDHPAYDMFGPVGSFVYAVDDGDAYFCRNCLGDGGNGVFIFHDDDYMTLYWHLK